MEKEYEYKDAGLTSAEDALRRLIDGEVFYYMYEGELNAIKYSVLGVSAPFVRQVVHGYAVMARALSLPVLHDFKNWETRKEVKKQWYEKDLGDGVLCWCWDDDYDNRVLAVIGKYRPTRKYPFVGKGWCYEKATPAISEEIDRYISR